MINKNMADVENVHPGITSEEVKVPVEEVQEAVEEIVPSVE